MDNSNNNPLNKIKEGKVEKIIGVAIVLVVIILAIVIKTAFNGGNKNLKTIYIATGGGKEDFIADPEIVKIMEDEYKLNVVYDSWSNGKTIQLPLVRETFEQHYQVDSSININSPSCTKYDALFTSDERYYNYYKLQPKDGEAARYQVLDGSLTLNTPIVIYSWKDVANALIKEKIVTNENGVYYIDDMNKLLNYILEGKTWSDIGLNSIYGKINIYSTDPASSSPGLTYYGLLLSVMTNGDLSDANIEKTLPKLKEFYKKSGYMNNTPADLFELYLKTGQGAKPMIVDYEKSLIEFNNKYSDAYKELADEIVILYPRPTIWNSHCIATFSEGGNEYLKAYDNEKLQNIAWKNYGFRVGTTGGKYDVTKVGINGIPKEITSVTSGLKKETYDLIEDYLSNK